MRPSPYALTTLGALLVAVSADCDNIDITSDGFTTNEEQIKTSETVHCTSDIAEPMGNGTLGCAIPTYAMGLVVHPKLHNVTTDDDDLWESILELVYSNVDLGDVNFNSTIVMNYTAPNISIKPNTTVYHTFMPLLECWNATLSDCDDDDDLEGVGIQACGYKYLPHAGRVDLGPGGLVYDGSAGTVTTDEGEANSTRPQPTYDEVKDQATDDDISAATSLASSTLAWALPMLSIAMVVTS
ncbi:hypothetical protein F5Y15DRAFT_404363 [Xylariaceae sp. FL0016]|nr:hypothetical protein F5Y15DRAFT_404363 [Xylariaceae sp. FL0016]